MPAPMTAFGEAAFQIVHEGEWLPLWDEASNTNTIHIPGSTTSVTFLLGTGPLTVTWTVECDDAAAYADLTALVQTDATLRMPTVVAERMGTEVDLSGQIYTEIPDVTLMQLAGAQIALDGSIQVNATFQRESRG